MNAYNFLDFHGWCSNSRYNSESFMFILFHPNENPALVLIFPVLTGLNYHSWARAMRIALMSKNKLYFVDGTLRMLTNTYPLYSTSMRCNTMILSWLNHSLSRSITHKIIWIDKTVEIWNDLKERFSQGNILRISYLQKEIYALKQGDRIVTDYFTKLKIIYDEMLNFQPISNCTCENPCNCGPVTKLNNIKTAIMWSDFFKG